MALSDCENCWETPCACNEPIPVVENIFSEIDCNKCVNKGVVNGLSLETFCDSCIHADKRRVNHFKSK